MKNSLIGINKSLQELSCLNTMMFLDAIFSDLGRTEFGKEFKTFSMVLSKKEAYKTLISLCSFPKNR